MDAVEPPRIVFEDPAKCSDADRAQDSLRRALGVPRPATSGWTVALTIERTGARTLKARGDIQDERGTRIAHRVLVSSGPDCMALSRGLGLWASLVLDSEGRRPATAAAAAQPAEPPVAQKVEPVEPLDPTLGFGAKGPEVTLPAPSPDKPSHEAEWFVHHEAGARTLEMGASGFLLTGAGVGPMAGTSPYLIVETPHGLFLRPSLAFGQTIDSFSAVPDRGTWIDSRMDACLRLPGLYSSSSGMQLDLCGGSDVGATVLDGSTMTAPKASSAPRSQWQPFAALGPSIDLRGELGGRLALTLRGVVGVNLLRPAIGNDVMSGRVEFALSWSLR